jgi:hypothetical protein
VRRLLVIASCTLAACSAPKPSAQAADSTSTSVVALQDSKVLRMNDGAEIWLAAGRTDTSATGEICTERLFELRREGKSIPVPLLYSMGAPTIVNDTTVRAALYRHCVPSAWYLVSTRTGQPVPDSR